MAGEGKVGPQVEAQEEGRDGAGDARVTHEGEGDDAEGEHDAREHQAFASGPRVERGDLADEDRAQRNQAGGASPLPAGRVFAGGSLQQRVEPGGGEHQRGGSPEGAVAGRVAELRGAGHHRVDQAEERRVIAQHEQRAREGGAREEPCGRVDGGAPEGPRHQREREEPDVGVLVQRREGDAEEAGEGEAALGDHREVRMGAHGEPGELARRRQHRGHERRRHQARHRERDGERAPRGAGAVGDPRGVDAEGHGQQQGVEERRWRARERAERHHRAEGGAARERGLPGERAGAEEDERHPGETPGEVQLPVVAEERAQGEEQRSDEGGRPAEALTAQERGHAEARQVEVEHHPRVRPVRRGRRARERADRPVERVVRACLRVGGEGRAAVLPRVPAGEVTVREPAAEDGEVGPVLLGHVTLQPGRGPAAEEVGDERVEEKDGVERQRSRHEHPRRRRAAGSVGGRAGRHGHCGVARLPQTAWSDHSPSCATRRTRFLPAPLPWSAAPAPPRRST